MSPPCRSPVQVVSWHGLVSCTLNPLRRIRRCRRVHAVVLANRVRRCSVSWLGCTGARFKVASRYQWSTKTSRIGWCRDRAPSILEPVRYTHCVQTTNALDLREPTGVRESLQGGSWDVSESQNYRALFVEIKSDCDKIINTIILTLRYFLP